MERKKKNRAASPEHPDVEVLKSVRALPQTMKSRFQLNLKPATIEESLIHCLNSVGCGRGETLYESTEYHNALVELSVMLTSRTSRSGILFTGQFGTGKTTLMLAIRKLFEQLGNCPSAWSYQEVNSLENLYARAEDFRFPIVSYDKFTEAASAPILFLDNLGIETDTPEDALAVGLIKNLIRLRYDLRLLTVIATPLDGQSIREVYGNQIASIMGTSYFVLGFDWEPFRK